MVDENGELALNDLCCCTCDAAITGSGHLIYLQSKPAFTLFIGEVEEAVKGTLVGVALLRV